MDRGHKGTDFMGKLSLRRHTDVHTAGPTEIRSGLIVVHGSTGGRWFLPPSSIGIKITSRKDFSMTNHRV